MDGQKGLAEQRSEVIDQFIGLEALVDCIIGVHYLGRLSLAFYHEVLYDEYFSFGLKVRILEKILSEDDKDAMNAVQLLRRANRIRNVFAHCGITRYESKTGQSYVPDPRNPEQGLDFEALHAEFSASIPPLRDFLLKKATEKGAQIRINRDGTWEEVRTLE